MKPFDLTVGDLQIGHQYPCFIIAEAGVNHNGDLDLAHQLVDTAVTARADAVKFQTFIAEKVVSATAPKAEYQKKTTETAESQLEMIKRLELPFSAFAQLKTYCEEKGILFLSTPFDDESADFLDSLGMSAFKIPSGEITNLPFLRHIARKGKPIIMSTGMATLGEVEMAVSTIESTGNPPLTLLHCVSNYPADPADVNLRAMLTLQTAFGLPVGYSDHTMGLEVSFAAVALGACVIEKHFTLDRALPGPDHQASLEPSELAEMVAGIRKIESALGNGRKTPAASERNTADVARKSLVAAQDLKAGVRLTDEHLAIKRPGTGLPPAMYEQIVGRVIKQDVSAGEALTLEAFL